MLSIMGKHFFQLIGYVHCQGPALYESHFKPLNRNETKHSNSLDYFEIIFFFYRNFDKSVVPSIHDQF